MSVWPEINSSIYGAWRLARRDPDGMNYMNLSVDGFWRSFIAIGLSAPAYILILLVQRAATGDETVSGPWGPEVLGYILGWVLWPLAALVLCRFLGLAQNFIPYIIAYNWANVVHINLLLPIAVLTHGSIMPDGMAMIISLVATLLVLVYLWWVTKVALGASTGVAMGFILLDILVGVLVSHGADRLFV